jgi:hypothetical protein
MRLFVVRYISLLILLSGIKMVSTHEDPIPYNLLEPIDPQVEKYDKGYEKGYREGKREAEHTFIQDEYTTVCDRHCTTTNVVEDDEVSRTTTTIPIATTTVNIPYDYFTTTLPFGLLTITVPIRTRVITIPVITTTITRRYVTA